MVRTVLRAIRKLLGYGLVVLVVWMIAVDSMTTRLFYPWQPEDIQRLSGNSKTAVVFLTGVQSSGKTHSAPLISLWGKHGDVVVVEYNSKRFDARGTVYEVHRKLIEWGYNRVLLIGASMGGLLATDVIDMGRATGSRLKFAVMMQDVPQNEEDLYNQQGAEIMATAICPGPVSNTLFTDAVWHFAFKPPPHYMLGDGVDQAQLEAHYHASSNYPLSGWAGEIRYLVRHRGFTRNQYVGIPLVIMQSQHDGVVKPTADKWKPIFGGATVITVAETSHIGFVEYPNRWRAAFEQGFASMSGW